MNEYKWLSVCRILSADIDGNRFVLAEKALIGKQAGIPDWDEKLGKLPNVRRAARTVREWAFMADFRQTLPRKFDLPFSHYVRASRYADRIDPDALMTAMETAEAHEESLETFGGFLQSLAVASGETIDGLNHLPTPPLIGSLTTLRDAISEVAERPEAEPVRWILLTAVKAMDEAVRMFGEKVSA